MKNWHATFILLENGKCVFALFNHFQLFEDSLLLKWSHIRIGYNKAVMSTPASPISPGYENLSLDRSEAGIEAEWPIRGKYYQLAGWRWVAHLNNKHDLTHFRVKLTLHITKNKTEKVFIRVLWASFIKCPIDVCIWIYNSAEKIVMFYCLY